jgi:hypothetical protein
VMDGGGGSLAFHLSVWGLQRNLNMLSFLSRKCSRCFKLLVHYLWQKYPSFGVMESRE